MNYIIEHIETFGRRLYLESYERDREHWVIPRWTAYRRDALQIVGWAETLRVLADMRPLLNATIREIMG